MTHLATFEFESRAYSTASRKREAKWLIVLTVVVVSVGAAASIGYSAWQQSRSEAILAEIVAIEDPSDRAQFLYSSYDTPFAMAAARYYRTYPTRDNSYVRLSIVVEVGRCAGKGNRSEWVVTLAEWMLAHEIDDPDCYVRSHAWTFLSKVRYELGEDLLIAHIVKNRGGGSYSAIRHDIAVLGRVIYPDATWWQANIRPDFD